MDTLQNQTILKVIDWNTAAQSATIILTETPLAQMVGNTYLSWYKMLPRSSEHTTWGLFSYDEHRPMRWQSSC